MAADDLIPGRGVVLVGQVAAAAGVDAAAVASLIETGMAPGLSDEAGRAYGFFDDEVPSADDLRAHGLEPTRDYRPDDVASYPWAPDEPDAPGAASWTMTHGQVAGLPASWSGTRRRTGIDRLRDHSGGVVGFWVAIEHRERTPDSSPGVVVSTALLDESAASEPEVAWNQLVGNAMTAAVSLADDPSSRIHDLLPSMEDPDDPRWTRTTVTGDLTGEARSAAPLGDDGVVVLVVRPDAGGLVTAVGERRLIELGLTWVDL